MLAAASVERDRIQLTATHFQPGTRRSCPAIPAAKHARLIAFLALSGWRAGSRATRTGWSGFALAGAACAGTISVDLYADLLSPTNPGYAPWPGAFIANIGALNDASLQAGDWIYSVSSVGIPLAPDARYWLALSSSDGSVAQWDYEADDSGISVAGEGYFNNTYGWSDNSTGAYLMTVLTTSGTVTQFDSIDGGNPVVGSDPIALGPLFASFSTGDNPGSLATVDVELYAPTSVPEPSTALPIGAGLLGLLVWRLRPWFARRALAIALPLAAGFALPLPATHRPAAPSIASPPPRSPRPSTTGPRPGRPPPFPCPCPRQSRLLPPSPNSSPTPPPLPASIPPAPPLASTAAPPSFRTLR
ncbi:MAG: hypothetical protein ABSF98_08485 [Bryobacteraceae bacterium]